MRLSQRFSRWRLLRLHGLISLSAFALTGCAAIPAPAPPPVPALSASASPFPSDEEALAAATSAYRDYLAMVDLILSEGGRDPERIREVATGDAADDFLRDAAEFATRGIRTRGSIQFVDIRLQRFLPASGEANVYVCDDLRAVQVVDTDGTPIDGARTAQGASFLIGFRFATDRFVVASRTHWEGDSLCVSL